MDKPEACKAISPGLSEATTGEKSSAKSNLKGSQQFAKTGDALPSIRDGAGRLFFRRCRFAQPPANRYKASGFLKLSWCPWRQAPSVVTRILLGNLSLVGVPQYAVGLQRLRYVSPLLEAGPYPAIRTSPAFYTQIGPGK